MARGIKDNRQTYDGTKSEPYREFMYLTCGEAITKGNVVRWAVAGEGTAPYAIVALATDTTLASHKKWAGVLIMQGDADKVAVGIATETGAIGDVIKVQTRGRGVVDITSAGSFAADTVNYIGASGAVASVAAGSISDADHLLGIVAYGLDADATNTCYADSYIVMTIGGW